ncbi:unnamed protein product, partial [Leptidea sinapis]
MSSRHRSRSRSRDRERHKERDKGRDRGRDKDRDRDRTRERGHDRDRDRDRDRRRSKRRSKERARSHSRHGEKKRSRSRSRSRGRKSKDRDGTIALLDQMVGTTTKATARQVSNSGSVNQVALLAAAAAAQRRICAPVQPAAAAAAALSAATAIPPPTAVQQKLELLQARTEQRYRHEHTPHVPHPAPPDHHPDDDTDDGLGAKIIIRGKGSVKEGKVGRKDGQPLPGEDEPLHAYITATNADCVKKAVEKGVEVPEGQNDLRRMQLRELAQLNGTLRETDAPRCANCSALDHKTWLVTLKMNYISNMKIISLSKFTSMPVARLKP